MSAISLERDYMLATENCKPSLTSTQALILTDLTHGVTIKEIAYARHIKRRTVSQHITDARARLNAETRDQMIAIFVTLYFIGAKNG
jgi:DNA-binding NarL/FixJ family response regulator